MLTSLHGVGMYGSSCGGGGDRCGYCGRRCRLSLRFCQRFFDRGLGSILPSFSSYRLPLFLVFRVLKLHRGTVFQSIVVLFCVIAYQTLVVGRFTLELVGRSRLIRYLFAGALGVGEVFYYLVYDVV